MIYIGTSGWQYKHWIGVFYPEGLRQKDWFEFYSRYFNTVEVNYSFYRVPSEKTFIKWREESPDGFIFSLKASRYITYSQNPRKISYILYLFQRRAYLLKEKRGPILIQFPKGYKRDDMALVSLIGFLREDFRWTVEFRDRSWFSEDVYNILKERNIAMCIIDSPDIRTPLITTSDFAYFRMHGREDWYASCYSDKELKELSERLNPLSREVKDVYVYFNNDASGYAVMNALRLKEYLN